MPKTVIVTGAAGFIGSNLCQSLIESGYKVVGIDNLSAGTKENIPPGTDFRLVDVLDATLSEHFKGAETVFHLAAKNCLADCAASPVETARVNVTGTANVLDACVKASVPHLVYADTSAEYEGVLEFPSQVDKVCPLSIYACSKRAGALMASAFPGYYPIKISTVRYFNVYGPAQDWRRIIPPVMSAFSMKLLEKQQPVIYGTGEKRRDFIHVNDINSFHLKLLSDSTIQGGTYNLGTGKDYSVLEIYDLIESEIRSGIKPKFLPELPGEAFRTQADISGTLLTGWSPQVDIKAGIRSFVKYTRERLSLDSRKVPFGK